MCWLFPTWYNINCYQLMSQFDRYQLQLVYLTATQTQSKRRVQCTEKVLWLIKRVESGLPSLVLEVSHWTMLLQVKLIESKTLIENNRDCTTKEIADILKISKSIVTGENEKCVFYCMEKTKMDFFANPVIKHNMMKICIFSSIFYIKMTTQKFTNFDKFFLNAC